MAEPQNCNPGERNDRTSHLFACDKHRNILKKFSRSRDNLLPNAIVPQMLRLSPKIEATRSLHALKNLQKSVIPVRENQNNPQTNGSAQRSQHRNKKRHPQRIIQHFAPH